MYFHRLFQQKIAVFFLIKNEHLWTEILPMAFDVRPQKQGVGQHQLKWRNLIVKAHPLKQDTPLPRRTGF